MWDHLRGRLHEPGLTGNPGLYINLGYEKITFTWTRVGWYLKPIHLTRVGWYLKPIHLTRVGWYQVNRLQIPANPGPEAYSPDPGWLLCDERIHSMLACS